MRWLVFVLGAVLALAALFAFALYAAMRGL